MAKKKGVNKVAIGAVGIGVLIAVSVVFVTGIGFDFVVPQDAEGLEVPVLTPSETDQVQDIIDEVSDLSDDVSDAENCLEGQEGSQEVIDTDECNQNIQDAIDKVDEKEMEIDELLPSPDLNDTDTSTDPPPDQVCDEFELNCGGTPKLELQTSITKIDSAGNSELVENTFDIPLASFFVEEETNIDYSTGRLEIKLVVKGDPTTAYMGTGKVDLLIAGQSVLTAPLDVQVDGMGEVDLLFGGISDTFTFSIEDNFDNFVNQEVTPIAVQVKELNISDGTENFSMADQEVFVMNILRDEFRVLIVDEEGGGTQRVYPTDSVLKVTGATTAVVGIKCPLYFKTTISGQTQTELGSTSAPTDPSGCYNSAITTVTIATDSPTLLGLNLIDGSGILLKSFAGGKGEVVNELLTRNANYTLTIASPSFSTDLSFPKSQQTQSYTCTNEYKINYIKETQFTNWGGGTTTKHNLVPSSYTITNVNCNFPN